MNQSLVSENTSVRSIRAGAGWVLTLFDVLERESISYCVLAGYDSLPENAQSDIDFMVSNEDFARMPSIMAAVERALGAPLVQFLQHETSACFYVFASPEGAVVTFMQADPAGDYKRHGRIWLRADDVLSRRRKHPRGFWIPAAADAFTYYLVKRVDKQILIPAHGEYLSRLYREDPSGCDSSIAKLWSPGKAAMLSRAASAAQWNHIIAQTREFAADLNRTSPAHKERAATLNELKRRVRRFLRPTGLLVVCMGPDGVGKSSVIEGLHTALSGCFRRNASFHLRPGALRGTKAGREFTATPHGRTERGLFGSIAKLIFLTADYVLGYYCCVRPKLVRSTLVIFDRYFHDISVDSKRYRYGGPKWLVRFCELLIPQPDLIFILDAPADVIYARKRELSLESIERLRSGYESMVTSLPQKRIRVIDASQPLEQVLNQCLNEILTFMQTRTTSRLHLQPGQEML